MPAAIFLQLLQQDLLPFTSINLLVLDECHLALQEHPYQHIMSLYKSSTSHQEPRVLGLTSNILKGTVLYFMHYIDKCTSLNDTMRQLRKRKTVIMVPINSFLASCGFCRLLITFENSLDPHEDRHSGSKRFEVFIKDFLKKTKVSR